MSEDYPPDGFGQDAIGRAFTNAAEHERLTQAVLDAALAYEEIYADPFCGKSIREAERRLIDGIRAYRAAKQ